MRVLRLTRSQYIHTGRETNEGRVVCVALSIIGRPENDGFERTKGRPRRARPISQARPRSHRVRAAGSRPLCVRWAGSISPGAQVGAMSRELSVSAIVSDADAYVG